MKESVEKRKEIEKNTYKLHQETTNSGSSMDEHFTKPWHYENYLAIKRGNFT